jgi:hypothetical protein
MSPGHAHALAAASAAAATASSTLFSPEAIAAAWEDPYATLPPVDLARISARARGWWRPPAPA